MQVDAKKVLQTLEDIARADQPGDGIKHTPNQTEMKATRIRMVLAEVKKRQMKFAAGIHRSPLKAVVERERLELWSLDWIEGFTIAGIEGDLLRLKQMLYDILPVGWTIHTKPTGNRVMAMVAVVQAGPPKSLASCFWKRGVGDNDAEAVVRLGNRLTDFRSPLEWSFLRECPEQEAFMDGDPLEQVFEDLLIADHKWPPDVRRAEGRR